MKLKLTAGVFLFLVVCLFVGQRMLMAGGPGPVYWSDPIVMGVDRLSKVAKVPLVASDSAGGLFAWANPEGATIVVSRVIVDVTTAASQGGSLADIGVASNATTSNDTLLDGASISSAALLDTIANKGTNGGYERKVTSSQYVTGSVSSGASAGIAGYAYIYFHAI